MDVKSSVPNSLSLEQGRPEEYGTKSSKHEVGFKYIGNKYFYSKNEASHTATFICAAEMALEGSLLDYQMADVVNSLFGQCNSWDLTVSYDAIVVTPEKGWDRLSWEL
ncbi:UNVERIFIED_CONTAM: hypothetical protein HDU68_011576 [Siphonaria sp. JEL0065]|nr:hypothetical protein HDU68_011576 [Siphonaria sp. JEL0065]